MTIEEAERLIINYPEDAELSVIHTRTGDERCNRDDMKNRQLIDAETADALVQLGDARRCEICLSPKEE